MRLAARLALLAAAAVLASCRSGPASPFVRIYADDGRVYYARTDRALHSSGGGFLAFRDLVTRESVHLKNGTYRALECPYEEVRERQREYMRDPDDPPRVEDYEDEPPR